MLRTVTELKKDTKYGYTLIANFIKDEHDQGGVTYELREVEEYDRGGKDWHVCLRQYKKFNNREVGNDTYRAYIRDGYKYVGVESF